MEIERFLLRKARKLESQRNITPPNNNNNNNNNNTSTPANKKPTIKSGSQESPPAVSTKSHLSTAIETDSLKTKRKSWNLTEWRNSR